MSASAAVSEAGEDGCYDDAVAEVVAPKISYSAYRAAEAARETKHEYLDGIERAMAGGTIAHGALAARVIGLFDRALAGRGCRVFSSDVRIRIEASNRSVYPDASIVCGKVEAAADDEDAIVNPVAIVEVLSESSEAYDRGEKLRHYKRLPSLREYLLVSQHEPLVELFRRDGDQWVVTEHGPGDRVHLRSLDVTLPVDDIFRDTLPH